MCLPRGVGQSSLGQISFGKAHSGSYAAKGSRPKFTRPNLTRQSSLGQSSFGQTTRIRPKSLGRSIQAIGQRSLGLSIQGVDQAHSAISVGLGQSDLGKAHSDSANFIRTRPCLLGQSNQQLIRTRRFRLTILSRDRKSTRLNSSHETVSRMPPNGVGQSSHGQISLSKAHSVEVHSARPLGFGLSHSAEAFKQSAKGHSA